MLTMRDMNIEDASREWLLLMKTGRNVARGVKRSKECGSQSEP
jgi:hypothetical protein